MSNLGRFFLGILLSLSFAMSGLALGTSLAGRFLVPEGQGMAGPTEALFYGFLAALAGLILGIVLSFFLRGKALAVLTAIALIPAVIIGYFVMQAVLLSGAEQAAL